MSIYLEELKDFKTQKTNIMSWTFSNECVYRKDIYI